MKPYIHAMILSFLVITTLQSVNTSNTSVTIMLASALALEVTIITWKSLKALKNKLDT